MNIYNETKEFLQSKEIAEYLNNSDFKKLYKKYIAEYIRVDREILNDVGILTQILYNAGIDPLTHLHKIPDMYMSHNNQLKTFTVPINITSIGERAFEYCSSLTDFYMPDSVTEIQYNDFCGCDRLKNIRLSDNIEDIPSYCFSECQALEQISIPIGVKYLGASAFEDCYKLTSVTLPETVTHICTCCFGECESLAQIVFSGTKEQWLKIRKDELWARGTENFMVYCYDGCLSQ